MWSEDNPIAQREKKEKLLHFFSSHFRPYLKVLFSQSGRNKSLANLGFFSSFSGE